MQFNWEYSSIFADRNEGFSHRLSADVKKDNMHGKSYGAETYQAINEIYKWLVENVTNGRFEKTNEAVETSIRKGLLKSNRDKNWVLFTVSSPMRIHVILHIFFKSKEDAALFLLNHP